MELWWLYVWFMSFKGNEYFNSIAVAPVTNWRYYDTIYTERYMRTSRKSRWI